MADRIEYDFDFEGDQGKTRVFVDYTGVAIVQGYEPSKSRIFLTHEEMLTLSIKIKHYFEMQKIAGTA